MANQYLLRGVNGKIGGYIDEDNPMPVSADDPLPVNIDVNLKAVFDEILLQLQITNQYLSILTNEEIS